MIFDSYFTVPVILSDNSPLKLHPESTVNLSCAFYGDPHPQLTWLKNNSILMNGTSGIEITTSGNLSVLSITDRRGESGGIYVCNASSVAGHAYSNFTIECKLLSTKGLDMIYFWSILDFPSPVRQTSILSVLENFVSVNWTIGEPGSSLPTEVQIEILTSNNNSLVQRLSIRINETQTTVFYLYPLTPYNFTYYVVSIVGRSRPITSQVTTLSLGIFFTT